MDRKKHLTSLLNILYSYLRKKESLYYFPLRLWIETSSRCNLRCGSCLNRSLSPDQKKDMDIDLYKRIIDQAAGNIYDANLFHRGEPLLHPQIAEMAAYASVRGIKTRIHTNATLLDRELGRELILAGLDSISFSLDSFTREDYEKKRKGADFDNTIDNIRQFFQVRKQLGTKKPFITFQLMEDTGTENLHYKENKRKMTEIFGDYPPDRLVVRRPHNWGGQLDGRPDVHVVGQKAHACTFPWYSLTIFFDGMAYPCPQDFMGVMPVGDLLTDTLGHIFNGKAMARIRKMFRSGNIDEKLPCFKCDRILRNTFMGIPMEYAGAFFRDNV